MTHEDTDLPPSDAPLEEDDFWRLQEFPPVAVALASLEQLCLQGPLLVTSGLLDTFLEGTKAHPAPAAERLRRLAVELESAEFERGFLDLHQIYQRAQQEAPEDIDVLISSVVSALAWTDPEMEPMLTRRLRTAEEAEKDLKKALQAHPGEAALHYLMGMLQYRWPTADDLFDDKAITRARKAFQKACDLDAEDALSQLYVGHCYEDLAQWAPALEAYAQVDRVQLRALWPLWRDTKVEEEMAVCMAYAGQVGKAKRAANTLFERLERMNDEMLIEAVADLDDLRTATDPEGPLSDANLSARLLRLVARLEALWAQEDEAIP